MSLRFLFDRRTLATLAGLAHVATAAVAAAPPPTPASTAVTPEAIAERALADAIAPLVAGRGASVKIVIAPSDARRSLAPCAQASGVVPPGARLVGRTMVNVRCTDGATWQAFVGADVQVTAAVWQATRPLRAGDAVAPADVLRTRAALTWVDLDPKAGGGAVDADTASPVGRTLQRSVGNGRTIAAADLRDAGRVNAGDPVRVVYRGDGFSVSADARAVGAADPGASLLVRLSTGTVVHGTVRDDHRVELAP